MEKEKKQSVSGRGRLRRLFSAGISAMLFLSTFFGALPLTETAAYYPDTEKKNQENTILGTLGIANPEVGTRFWQGNYVYYGLYKDDQNIFDMHFRVLDNDSTDFSSNKHTLFLDSETIVTREAFNGTEGVEARNSNWKGSKLQTLLNDTILKNSFTPLEQDAIIKSTKSNPSNTDGKNVDGYDYAKLDGDKLFVLDAREATNTKYGYPDKKGEDEEVGPRIKTDYTGVSSWLLRSPFKENELNTHVGLVGGDEDKDEHPGQLIYTTPEPRGVSPALNIDCSRVLFATDMDYEERQGQKYGHSYVLTLKDDALSAKVTGDITRVGNKITIPYEVTRKAGGGDYDSINRVSVLITDKDYTKDDAKIIKYDALNLDDGFKENGKGWFEFTNDEVKEYNAASDHKIYLIAEHSNLEKEVGYTDYASEPSGCDITNIVPAPKDTKITFDPNGGKVSPTSGVTGANGKLTKNLPTPTRNNYKADGWWTKKEGGNKVDNNTVFTKECTIYAHWKEVPLEPHTITVTVEGKGKVTPSKTSALKGEKISLDKKADSGWKFSKWEVLSGGVKIRNNAFTMPDKNVKIKAVFIDKSTIKHKITAKTNGHGKAKASHSKAVKGKSITVRATAETGYRFRKWTGTKGVKFKNAKSRVTTFTMPGKNVTVKAVFKKVVEPPFAKLTPQGNNEILVEWRKVNGADGYDIYFARCNLDEKKTTPEKIATVKGNDKLKWTVKKLDAGKPYKAYVRAYAMEKGKKKYISKSPTMHVYTGGGKGTYTYAKKMELNKDSVTVKVGKKYTFNPTIVLKDPAKKKMSKAHGAAIRYMSTNPGIARVNAKGEVTGVAPGNCHIYVYAINGAYKRVPVTVTKK